MKVRGLILATTVSFGVLGVGLAFSVAPALAAAPETPETVSPAKGVTATSATLEGVLNPGAPGEVGEYEFLYKASASECAEGSVAPQPAGIALGLEKEQVSVELTGLQSGTQYTFCVLAKNAAEETALGAPVTFRTSAAVAPTIAGESVTEVTATSASFQAQVDPGGAETTYHIDYGTTASYGQSTPESGSIGANDSQNLVASTIQGLEPGATYHYRLVVTNSQSPAGGTLGPDETFTTQTAGGEFTLPDGRQYELVSPPQKDGAEILGIGGGGETPGNGDATQASEDGMSVTDIATAPVSANPPGNTLSTQLLSTRGIGGWSSQDIAVPHKNSIGVSHLLNEGEEYVRFSSDLSRAVLLPLHQTPEPPLAPELHQEVEGGSPNGDEIYVRNNATNLFQAVVTAEPLPKVAFEGATPDLRHVVFGGPAGLDPNHLGSGRLYEWAHGEAQLVNVLPNGEVSGLAALGGGTERFGELVASQIASRHSISNDGTRIVWGNGSELLTRDMANGETVEVDAAQGGTGASGGGVFQDASSDGSRVFFTDASELTGGANEGGLFMFDLADGKLIDLTPEGNGAQVESFFGVNEEGTSVYVVDKAVLTNVANGRGETAEEGAPNTYLLREAPVGSRSWSATFITIGVEEGSLEEEPLTNQTVRVSPNGRYLAFMSRESLTGYDNRDANSGEPDEEVYLYDAEANRLVCASCDPTGARPVGEYDSGAPRKPMDPWAMWEGHWLAASIPGWTPDGIKFTTGYQPRFLGNSGRLFFDSADALVPRDVDGKVDVYEYEATGVGNCDSPGHGQSASVVFSEAAGGCVGLISAGTGSGDSVFFDASASGDDVFFTTADGLVGQDNDGVFDMYDARICTVAEPCAQSPVAAPPPCATADSCRTAPSPQPGVFAAPASATFAGAGNATSTVTATVEAKAKAKTAADIRARKLARALKVCNGKSRKRRAVCKAKARKRYGTAKTSGRRIK